MDPFWEQVHELKLHQGDWLPQCLVPLFNPKVDPHGNPQQAVAREYDLVVITQSCDLEQRSSELIAVVPIFTLAEFESTNPAMTRKGRWNDVLKGRVEGLHLLSSPTSPEDNRQALVVNFREIFSLPFDYLTEKAGQVGPRWRLRSPYLEHFSQAFARFFMRVGLPSTIPVFK